MKKIIRLTEEDLAKIVKRVISETQENFPLGGIKIKKLTVVKNSDGSFDKSTLVLNNNDKVVGINNISAECGSGDKLSDPKCLVQLSTINDDLSCVAGNCSKMK